ncbi:MAG: ornithine carbamoyltransferase [Planctomycetaceae bacterium]|nr:ornithine carbamoyltransferase [Planctomycetaceae bacterium]
MKRSSAVDTRTASADSNGSGARGNLRHLNSVLDLSRKDIDRIFALTKAIKDRWSRGDRPPVLAGRVMAQVFEKPSLRTRVSFESAMMQLGGSSLFLTAKDAGLGGRESTCDVARVLGGYCDVIVLRTFSQKLIDDFIRCSGTHVINGLSDVRHPCQALTDLYTMHEVFGDVAGKKFVFVGDGNNVATSLAGACALLDVPLTICAPDDYRIDDAFLAELKKKCPKAKVTQTSDFASALKDAAIVYTDVWTSMGQEAEDAERCRIFAPYQVNEQLMSRAPKSARFLHCLPAKRGREVTDAVIDGPNSLVFQQAENRMHLAKGLLCWMLGVEV